MGSGGGIGGGISVNTLAQVTTTQSYSYIGTSSRMICFDQQAASYWDANSPVVAINLGAANAYAAGTVINIMCLNNSATNNFPNFTITSAGATFVGIAAQNSGPSPITLSGFFRLVSDGTSKWYVIN